MSEFDETQSLLRDSTLPLSSVILPIYQADRGVYRAINSVFNQTYDNIELLIVDSSGASRIAEFAELDGVVYEFQEASGVSKARNQGLELASGEYISFLDADDQFAADKLNHQINALRSDNAEICYTDVVEHSRNGTSRRNAMPVADPDNHDLRFFVEDGRLGNIATSSLVFTREVIEDEHFDTSFPVKEDYHLWVRLFKQGRAIHIEKALTHVWLREESLSSDPEAMYTYGIEAARDLANCDKRYESLLPSRIAVERYGYGRQLLLDEGETKAARSVFYKSIIKDRYYRAMVLIILSFLPVPADLVVSKLDRFRHGIITRL